MTVNEERELLIYIELATVYEAQYVVHVFEIFYLKS
jgi:hypothetical protein